MRSCTFLAFLALAATTAAALAGCGSTDDNAAFPSDASAAQDGHASSSGSAGSASGSTASTGGAGSAEASAGSVAGSDGNSGSSGSAGSGSSAASVDGSTGPVADANATASSDSATSDATAEASASITAPCDLYATGGTPCVAAHSTVRALFGAYAGRLYQVRRASDKTTKDVGVTSAGGFADSAAQDAFCAGTTCTISALYDQSSRGNHLASAPGGGAVRTADAEANATALKLTVGGHTVYGVYVSAGTGYRVDKTSGVATGDAPEGEYMVTSGKHYNGGCCFDYGNAETSNDDTGNGHMEAIYFGNCTVWGKGAGSGPWVMADLENGLFAGSNTGLSSGNTSVSFDYVAAMVKGEPGHWAIKAGNAQSGGLTTMWDGQRPANGYNPMHKEGAIILGIGGDNSNGAVGSFFEGCMTSGYPSTATDDAVQANIVAAGYGH